MSYFRFSLIYIMVSFMHWISKCNLHRFIVYSKKYTYGLRLSCFVLIWLDADYSYIYMYISLLLISMLWHRQAMVESKRDKLSSSAECRNGTQGLRHQIASRMNACWQTDWVIEDQTKSLNSISEHSAHSTPQPVGSHTWLWRYT